MKKPDLYLREYCSSLSDENVRFLATRLGQKMSGDLAEALDFVSRTRELDRWLGSARSSDELYDMIDMIQTASQKEYDKRYSN